MSEAQRLNMVGGHFIWLWADTSSTTEFYDTASSSSPIRAPVGSLRGADVPPGSPSQSAANGARDKSRMPVVTSSSSSMGRQRENDRRTDQRVPGKGRKQQQQGGSRRENEQNNDNKARERFHLPVAGRSRPAVSEQDDKSRSRRDLANPIVESSSQASVSSSNAREQLADGDNGQFYYDEEQVFGSEEHHLLDSEDVEDVESERRILEMLGKAPASHQQQHYKNNEDTSNGGDGEEAKGEEEESIRLAVKETKTVDGDHNKWTASGNQTSSADPAAAKSTPSDIDPVIKAEGESPEDEEEVAKLKRMLNLANMNNSDVLFHHFKDFPIGLLALRPVRMDVDRYFIKATVQLFANTWKRIEGAGRVTEQSRSWQFDGERWKRKRRRKRSVGEKEGSVDETTPNTSDKLDVMDSSSGYGREELFNGANTKEVEDDDDKLGQIVVNNTLNQQNQSFNTSDLGQRVQYYRRILLRDPNASSITSNVSHKSRSTFYGEKEEKEEESSGENGYAVDGGNSTEDMAISDSPTTDHVVDGEPSETGAVPGDPIMMGLGSGGGAAVDSDKHQQRDDSGLHVDYNIKPSASGSYLRGGNIAMLDGNTPAESFGSEVAGISNTRGSEDTLSNMKIKTKRKYGASEQQEVNRIRSGGAPASSVPAPRQQILGSWTKVGGNNNHSGGRSRLGSPQYSGGCYGTPTKNDAKRAESFARYVRTHATCF